MSVSVNVVTWFTEHPPSEHSVLNRFNFHGSRHAGHRLVVRTEDETQLKKDDSWGWKIIGFWHVVLLAWYWSMMSNIQKLYILVWNPWETPLSKSFKVVRYFSSKERELKVRTWLKLSSKISGNIKLRRGLGPGWKGKGGGTKSVGAGGSWPGWD